MKLHSQNTVIIMLIMHRTVFGVIFKINKTIELITETSAIAMVEDLWKSQIILHRVVGRRRQFLQS